MDTSIANKQEFGHNTKLSPSKDVKDSKQLSKSFISNKNTNYDKMFNKMSILKFENRN